MAEKEKNRRDNIIDDVPQEDKKNIFYRIGDGVENFGKKHPKICKWTKRGLLGAAMLAIGGFSYNKGKSVGAKTNDAPRLDVDTNYYEPTYNEDYSESYIPQNEAASESYETNDVYTAESSSETIVNE